MSNHDLMMQELFQASDVLDKFMRDKDCLKAVDEAAALLIKTFRAGNKVISAGNGGSHCDAMHFAEELTGRYRDDRDPLPAVAISDPSYLSCTSNDYGFEHVFSRFIKAMGQAGDVFFGLSTSGNSKNIINAIEAARNNGCKVILLTGNTGGKMDGLADVEIRVPHHGYADRIQEVHIKIIHILILLIEKGMK